MKLKNEFIFYVFISILLLLVFIGTYIFRQRISWLPSNSNNWSNFGSYISGVGGAILGLLNLIVLVRLTLTIDKSDDKRLITELRFNVYQEASTKLNEINVHKPILGKYNPHYFTPDKKNLDKVSILINYLEDLRPYLKILFDSHKDYSLDALLNEVIAALSYLQSNTEEVINLISSSKAKNEFYITEKQIKNLEEDFNRNLKKFSDARQYFLVVMLYSTRHLKLNNEYLVELFRKKNDL
jgi:hypothetical protein